MRKLEDEPIAEEQRSRRGEERRSRRREEKERGVTKMGPKIYGERDKNSPDWQKCEK